MVKNAPIETINDAKEKIERAIESNGQFTHNILGLILRKVDGLFGTKVANDLIDEYDLEDYGINKEPVD